MIQISQELYDDLMEYLKDCADVEDRGDGSVRPNRAMTLYASLGECYGDDLTLKLKLSVVLAAYEKALEDQGAKLPTYVHAALEAARK